MHNRRVIAALGLAVVVAFLAALAWRATVWHTRGWAGFRYVSGIPDGMTLPPPFADKVPKAGWIDIVIPGSPAAKAGIRQGDRVVTIDGIPISDFGAIHRRADLVRRGDAITYRILRDGVERVVTIRTVSPLGLPTVAAGTLSGIVLMLSFLAIALLVLWHRPTSGAAVVFHWFCVLGSGWAAMTAFVDLDMVAGDGLYAAFARLGVYISYLLVVTLATAFGAVLLHLALVFPRELPLIRRRPWLIGWMYAVPITFGALPLGIIAVLLARGIAMKLTVGILLAAVAVLLVARRRTGPWHQRPLTTIGIVVAALHSAVAFIGLDAQVMTFAILVGGTTLLAILVSLLSAFAYSIATIVALVAGYRGSTAEEKRQLRWPLWGTLTAIVISLIASAVFVYPTHTPRPSTILLLGSTARLIYILIPLTFAFAILKYRLMDIDVVIKKTMVYSIATGVVIVAFFVLVAGIGSYLTAMLNIRSQTLTVLSTLIVAALFVPLRNRVQRGVERRFFQRSYDASEAEKLIQQEIVSSQSLDELLPRIAEYIQQALQVRSVVLFTPAREDDPQYRPAATIGVARETIGSFTIDRASIAHLSEAAEVSALRLSEEERTRVRRLHAELVVPLRLRDRTRGVMLVGSMLSGRFDEDDRRFLDDVAQQIAFALEKLTVTEEMRDFERALEIQRALLPKSLPRIEGVELDAAWRPARTVGGDYYDVLPLGPSTLGLCIADVAGKGMPAALLMANLQAAVKATASADQRPDELCAKVSTVVTGTLTGGRFVTFFYALYDARERVIRYTNAGHNPPLLLRAGGSVERLAGGGSVFARMMHGSPYETHEQRLAPGDTLVLFTDGVTEARNAADEEFGESRLVEVCRRADSAAATVNAIVDEVQRFCGGAAQDDLTLLVMRTRA